MAVPGGGGRRLGRVLLGLVVVASGVTGLGGLLGTTGGSAGASTGDPPSNIYPDPPFFEDCSSSAYDNSNLCANQTVQAIDNARAQENVGPMTLPSDWYQLTPTEQLYVATNLERTARGLPALSAMSTQLDQAANDAASKAEDGYIPSGFTAGTWSSNWAGGAGNALEDVYFWMYYDGQGSNNVNCTSAGQSGCWIHRHNILIALQCQPCMMGTGYSPTGWQGGTSWVETLADTSGSPPVDFTWGQVEPSLPPSEWGSGSTSSPAPAASSNNATPPSSSAPAPSGPGHRMVEANGGVFDFGGDRYYGSVPGLGIDVQNIVGMATTRDSSGYWLVGSDGGIFAFGDAGYFGSVPGTGARVNDIVGMATTPDGNGYWMVGSDGGIFAFGDARYFGSVPGLGRQDGNIVGIAPVPGGGGYWLIGRYGEIWSFGSAQFLGSPEYSNIPVSNIVAMVAAPGGGYWLVGSDGGIFGFGGARYLGSVPGAGVSVNDIVAIAPTLDGGGYWIYGADGGVFCFGDAQYFGSVPGLGIQVHDIRSGTST